VTRPQRAASRVVVSRGGAPERKLRIQRPDLVVDAPFEHASYFFSTDASSRGPKAYDQYVLSGASPPNQITLNDVTAINQTMRARAPHGDWLSVIAEGVLPELSAIPEDCDLFLASEEMWLSERIPERLTELFGAVLGPGIGISRATKVLHIKRPRLVPVCDSNVLSLMGIPGSDDRSAVALIQHLRDQRSLLTQPLLGLQRRLADAGYPRTLVRIADALIWSSHPDTWMARRADTPRIKIPAI